MASQHGEPYVNDMSDSARLCQLLGVRHPIVQAPMANYVTTPELVAAVSESGALGSVGAPYYSAEEITKAAEAIRERTAKPFALNLFIPIPARAPSDVELESVRPILNAFRTELGLPSDPEPKASRDAFDAQFEAVLRARPPVFSFTMGILDRDRLRALHGERIVTIGTATTPDEAVALEEASIDVVCAQGAEAGGHRGTFLVPTEEGLWGVTTLVQQIARRVRIPVLAAGGIMDGRGIAAALAAGASGVQLGTAFLTCPEAGTASAHKAALHSEAARRTVLTKAFSGRHGRALANRYTEALAGVALPPFPAMLGVTSDVRSTASKEGRSDLMQMWAGQGAPLVRDLPAAKLVAALVEETRAALAEVGSLQAAFATG